MTEYERIAVLETEMKSVQSDIAEIKASLKALEIIAQRGGGALHTILIIGGLIGWITGIGTAFYSLLRH